MKVKVPCRSFDLCRLTCVSTIHRYYLEDKEAAERAAQAEKRRQELEAKAKSEAAARARQAEAAAKAAKPGATISLFGFGQQEPDESSAKQGVAAAAKAPRGVPTIIKWKRRNDGT